MNIDCIKTVIQSLAIIINTSRRASKLAAIYSDLLASRWVFPEALAPHNMFISETSMNRSRSGPSDIVTVTLAKRAQMLGRTRCSFFLTEGGENDVLDI